MRDWVKTQCMARARARARARERGLGSWGARSWRLGPGRGLVLKLGLVVREGEKGEKKKAKQTKKAQGKKEANSSKAKKKRKNKNGTPEGSIEKKKGSALISILFVP